MDKKQKYLAYGCGFLMGLCLVILLFGKKFQTKFQQKPISTTTHHIVLGQDMRAKKPMPVELALTFKEYPTKMPDQYLRVLIFKDQTQDRLLKVEETILREPTSSSEKLLLRKQMLADKVLIRLKDPKNNIKELTTFFESLQLNRKEAGRRAGLYYLKLNGKVEDPDALSDIIQQLSLNEKIEIAMPVYLNERL